MERGKFIIHTFYREDCATTEREEYCRIPYIYVASGALEEWYGNLADMMRAEGVTEKGHLQINRNVILNLTELHGELLASTKYPFYNAAYFKALPFIVELRQKSGRKEEPEVDTCFEALYGVLLLRLQKKEISQGTAKAMEAISGFVSLLANYYDKEKRGELELMDKLIVDN